MKNQKDMNTDMNIPKKDEMDVLTHQLIERLKGDNISLSNNEPNNQPNHPNQTTKNNYIHVLCLKLLLKSLAR
jgi:hypothetical protein